MSARNVPWRLVEELHALPDQLADGDLPDRGAARVEAALDVSKLRYEHAAGDRARVAAALIRHLDTHPDDGDAHAATDWLNGLAERACDGADYPERMDDETERLVMAAFSLDGHDYTTRPAARKWLANLAEGTPHGCP